jgi:D-arabinitol 2-dehydrogenase
MGEVPLIENGELPLEKPTLSTFSLAGRVCAVTGGAQGLGLVMSQALVMSGASVALIDLQSKVLI